ncbi:MAG: hypothetical protein HOQ32_01690 [Lysobacter sp.]|nr:hypothetical protein [Lysobacter sp.]
MKIYKQLFVWKKIDAATAVRFCCLEDLVEKKFAVQSADFLRLPASANDFSALEHQFLELFLEMADERSDWFGSVEEAITSHEQMFS